MSHRKRELVEWSVGASAPQRSVRSSMWVHARALTVAALAATGCAPPATSGPDRSSDAPAVSVDGVPVDCTRTTTIATASATPRVVIAPPEGVEVEITLDGADVSDRFSSTAPLAATLELTAGEAVSLVVARDDAPWQCRASLVHRSSAEQALADLEAASASEVVVTRTSENGSVSSAVVEVPAEGANASERAEAFLAEHADVFSVAAWQLREREQWESPDGWTTVVFEQWLSDRVLAFESSLEVELDAAGVVRTLHAHLYADLEAAPAFALDPTQALALAEAEIGPPDGFVRVVYDRSDPRPGWHVVGEGGAVLVDDERAEVAWATPPFVEAAMELHHPTPNPLVDTRRGVPGSTVIARGDSGAGAPSELSAAERAAWATTASIVGHVEVRTGSSGWPGVVRIVTQDATAEGTTTLPDGSTARVPGAFYLPGRGTMFLDGAARERKETICHEYGHAFDDARGGLVGGTFAECLGDVFYLFCEPWVNPGGVLYAYNDGGRRHDRPHGRSDQFDYDAFRSLGVRETSIGRGATVGGAPIGTHDHAFLVTHALYQMMESYGLDREKAAQLGFSSAAGRYSTYPEMRDRVLSDAVSWARSGRHTFTEEDACAVAQGFRHTKLDGEYGSGADCERSGRTDLVCTSRYCPPCGQEEAPSVCRPESLEPGQPVCMTADGRRTCVGSIALSGEGCPSGQGRSCWCIGDGRWSCDGAGDCRPFGDQPLYCPEDPGPGASAGAAPAGCAAARPTSSPASRSGWASGLFALAALALVVLRRRR